jgi:hypothetical protein
MEIDLHGYHPSQIVGSGVLGEIVQQAWEMGEPSLTLIHGHGRNRRNYTPTFVNTNTGYFGLEIRRELRYGDLRTWIHHTTLDCSKMGATTVRLRRNPSPSRASFNSDILPEQTWA